MQSLNSFNHEVGMVRASKMTTHHSQHMDEDCQPKDLTFKPNKKLKPIPPPLNLGIPNNSLKEFAIIATSPKSPLMQKNLPFRKRAHSLTNMSEHTQHSSPSETTVLSEHRNSLPSLDEESPTPAPLVVTSLSGRQSHINPSPMWSPTVLSPPQQWTSALLSPAPSSLGSSREELSAGGGGVGSQSLVWHCFQPGTLLKVECVRMSTGGTWRPAEDIPVPDWLDSLQVEVAEETEHLEAIRLNCSALNSRGGWEGEVSAQCHRYHTFHVVDKGLCAVSPDEVSQHLGFVCQPLEKGDICLPPPKLTVQSPDICDRFKRFSFPPDESCLPPPSSPLSPPTSPTKKPRDPNRPKRPMNAFMLFAKRYRLQLIQLHPGKDNRAISVVLGEAWRNLPFSEKELYVTEARSMAQEQKRLHPDCWKRKRSHSTS